MAAAPFRPITVPGYLWLAFIALPFCFLFVVFFVIPLVFILASAFQSMDLVTFVRDRSFTFAQFTKFFGSPFYLSVASETFVTASCATIISLLLGYPMALHLWRAPTLERRVLWLIMLSPLVVSVVILNFGWLIIMSPQGVINSVLMGLRLTSKPVDMLFTRGAVVAGLVHINLPFMVIAIENTLRSIAPEVIRSAQSLGSNPRRLFLHVVLPLSTSGAVSGCVIVFALSASAFVTPLLLGGTWVKTMAALAYEQALVNLDIPFAGAIAIILLVGTVIVVTMIERIGAAFQPRGIQVKKRSSVQAEST